MILLKWSRLYIFDSFMPHQLFPKRLRSIVDWVEQDPTNYFTVITCKRKSILCHEANVALMKEAFPFVANQRTLRIRAFVLYPDHTCLRSARRQVYGICTFDVNVGHE